MCKDLPRLHVGDHVRDRDNDESRRMVVTSLPGLAAKEFEIQPNTTVADVNGNYPASDGVVSVVFPDRGATSLGDHEAYAYPRSRLERVGAIHTEDSDDE